MKACILPVNYAKKSSLTRNLPVINYYLVTNLHTRARFHVLSGNGGWPYQLTIVSLFCLSLSFSNKDADIHPSWFACRPLKISPRGVRRLWVEYISEGTKNQNWPQQCLWGNYTYGTKQINASLSVRKSGRKPNRLYLTKGRSHRPYSVRVISQHLESNQKWNFKSLFRIIWAYWSEETEG